MKLLHLYPLQAIHRFIAIIAMVVFSCSANAQDLDPRRYVNLPIGQNFFGLAYAYSEGDVNASPSVPLSDASIRVDGPAVIYARTFGLAGNSGSFDVLLPYTCASGRAFLDGTLLTRSVCGPADARFRVSYNFIGAKAVSLREFARQPKNIVVGTSLQVSAPTGQYDNDKLLNIGTNRWYLRPEIGLSIPWRKWSFEFAAGVRLFTDNNDFLGTKFTQDPLYNVQGHVIFDVTQRQWISLDGNYFFGGDTYRNGIQSAPRQKNSRLGLTWAIALNSQHTLKFLAHTGVSGRISNDSDMFTVAWVYRWDS
jgi:hypothetical protein